MFRNMRVGRPKGKSGKNAYPLRKVVERYAHEELLDCGHIIPTPRDFIGETNALRRRCRQCYKEVN